MNLPPAIAEVYTAPHDTTATSSTRDVESEMLPLGCEGISAPRYNDQRRS